MPHSRRCCQRPWQQNDDDADALESSTTSSSISRSSSRTPPRRTQQRRAAAAGVGMWQVAMSVSGGPADTQKNLFAGGGGRHCLHCRCSRVPLLPLSWTTTIMKTSRFFLLPLLRSAIQCTTFLLFVPPTTTCERRRESIRSFLFILHHLAATTTTVARARCRLLARNDEEYLFVGSSIPLLLVPAVQ